MKFENKEQRDCFLQKLFFGTFIIGGFAWCWIDIRIFIGLLVISFIVFVINEPSISGLENDEEKVLRRESFLERNVLWMNDKTFTKDEVSKILSDSYWQEKIISDRKREDATKTKIFLFGFYGWTLLFLIYAYFYHFSL